MCVASHKLSMLRIQFSFRVWISSENAAKVVDRKFRIVHAPSDYFYLVSRVVPAINSVLIYFVYRIAAVADGLQTIRLGRSLHTFYDPVEHSIASGIAGVTRSKRGRRCPSSTI